MLQVYCGDMREREREKDPLFCIRRWSDSPHVCRKFMNAIAPLCSVKLYLFFQFNLINMFFHLPFPRHIRCGDLRRNIDRFKICGGGRNFSPFGYAAIFCSHNGFRVTIKNNVLTNLLLYLQT